MHTTGVALVERGLCGYGFEFDIDAISYQPTCYSNMTGSLFPFTSNPTMKLYAGRYWYQYHAYGSPFSGGEGNFTVSGPTTVYLNYSGVPANYCDNKQSINASALNANAPSNTIRITPLVGTQSDTQVTFTETGLPSGSYWNIQQITASNGSFVGSLFGGGVYPVNTGAGQEFTVTIPNGNYTYTAACSTGPTAPLYYCATGGGYGSFSAAGRAITVIVNFSSQSPTSNVSSTTSTSTSTVTTTIPSTPQTCGNLFGLFCPSAPYYKVTFAETGLPKGGLLCFIDLRSVPQWIVTLGGVSQSATGTSISSFYLQNGTYSYTVTPPPNYTAGNLDGTVVVNGGPTTETINFTKSAQQITNSTTACSNPVNPTLGSEGPCITVSASQCIGNAALCPNDTTPLYDALTLELTPASNYYEVLIAFR